MKDKPSSVLSQLKKSVRNPFRSHSRGASQETGSNPDSGEQNAAILATVVVQDGPGGAVSLSPHALGGQPARRPAPAPSRPSTLEHGHGGKELEEIPLVEKSASVAPASTPAGTLNSDIYEHQIPIAELAALLDTQVDVARPRYSRGLTQNDAEARLARYGPNTMSPPARYPWYLKFLELLTNFFNMLLLAGGIGYLILFAMRPTINFANVYIGTILVAVAFLNAGIELYELSRIYDIMSSLKGSMPPFATCIREGIAERLPVRDLVPGDVVHIRAGDKVPADAIVFSCQDLKADVSSINGESELALILAQPGGTGKGVDVLEASNILFNGCLVSSGDGYAILIRTGDRTVLGQLSRFAKSEKRLKSPLSRGIGSFSRIISVLAFVTAFLFFFIALAKAANFNYAITFSIGILVSWIPQGLPVSVTMILSIACARMAKRQVLVKDLHGVETLGAITLLATDKTGTLTTNKMTVMSVWTDGKHFHSTPTPSGDGPAGLLPLKLDASGVAHILQISVTNNHAKWDRTDGPASQRTIIGDATDAGLLKWAGSCLANIDRIAELYPRVFEVPFTSETKYQLSIHRKAHSNGGLSLHVKGAPEVVFALCTHIWIHHRAEGMSERRRVDFHAMHAKMCEAGHRVLAFAFLPLPGEKYPDNWRFELEKRNYPADKFVFLGLVSLQDPPKSGVRQCIGVVRQAGIKVLMVTGDHPSTAQLISRQVNILTHPSPSFIKNKDQLPLYPPGEEAKSAIVITGPVLHHFCDGDWFAALCHDEVIFARTSPVQKLEIVKRAQAMGHIVGVTGDGINDSAALKKADLGISMNLTGSDASKENAGMVLLDDNFASTANGIFEGV
jgi:sodium/potassium-transporting ATPase subunit alpha